MLELKSFSFHPPQLIICISLSGAPVLAFAKDILPSCFISKIYDSALQRDAFPRGGFFFVRKTSDAVFGALALALGATEIAAPAKARLTIPTTNERSDFRMTNPSSLSNGELQGFYEDLYVYCSEKDSYQIAERFQKELKVSFPEIDDLPDFSVGECDEDEYELAVELEPGSNQEDFRPYMITQHFFLEVLNLSDQVIDPISDAVFEAVQRATEDVPYFSFMGFLKENHSEDE